MKERDRRRGKACLWSLGYFASLGVVWRKLGQIRSKPRRHNQSITNFITICSPKPRELTGAWWNSLGNAAVTVIDGVGKHLKYKLSGLKQRVPGLSSFSHSSHVLKY